MSVARSSSRDDRGAAVLAAGSRVLDAVFSPGYRTGDSAAGEAGWQADGAEKYCRRCGTSVGLGEATDTGCARCRGTRPAWRGVWRLGAYRPPLDEWIIAMKFHGAWSWAPWFARQLGWILPGKLDPMCNIVVPVPLHWIRRVSRGYDQSAFIGRGLARAAGLRFGRVLRRQRRTVAQSSIRAQHERLANVRGAFALHPVDLCGWTVWLVDDVKTTGATARECARLLTAGGAERVNLVVLAVAEPQTRDIRQG